MMAAAWPSAKHLKARQFWLPAQFINLKQAIGTMAQTSQRGGFDCGTTHANILRRIHPMVSHADAVKHDIGTPIRADSDLRET